MLGCSLQVLYTWKDCALNHSISPPNFQSFFNYHQPRPLTKLNRYKMRDHPKTVFLNIYVNKILRPQKPNSQFPFSSFQDSFGLNHDGHQNPSRDFAFNGGFHHFWSRSWITPGSLSSHGRIAAASAAGFTAYSERPQQRRRPAAVFRGGRHRRQQFRFALERSLLLRLYRLVAVSQQ